MTFLSRTVPVAAILLASAAAMAEGPAPLAQQVSWPGVQTVWQHGTTFIASAPNREGLGHAKSQGVTTVINLMLEDEDPAPFWPQNENEPKPWFMYLIEYFAPIEPWNEAKAVQELGLRYENVPIDTTNPSPAEVDRFLAIMRETNARQTLIHCEASGRALAMWAIYLGTDGGLTPQQALAQAEQAGLNHTGLKNFVLNYLQSAQKVS